MADTSSQSSQSVGKSETPQSSMQTEAAGRPAVVAASVPEALKSSEDRAPQQSASPTFQSMWTSTESPSTLSPSGLDYRVETREAGPAFQSEISSYFPGNRAAQGTASSRPLPKPPSGAQTTSSAVCDFGEELPRATQASPGPMPYNSPLRADSQYEGSAELSPPHCEPRSTDELSTSAVARQGISVPSIAASSTPISSIDASLDRTSTETANENKPAGGEKGDAVHTRQPGKANGDDPGNQSEKALPQIPVTATTSVSAPALVCRPAVARAPTSTGISSKPSAAQEQQKMIPTTPPKAVEVQRPRRAKKGKVAARAAIELKTAPAHAHMHGNVSQMDTQYMTMMLALDDISMVYGILAKFFAWVLLAGFVVLPGTFSHLQMISMKAGTATVAKVLIDDVTQLPLFLVVWVCMGIGALGKLWLWWRWRKNYIFALHNIFVPGFTNSLVGVLSTLASVFGSHHGKFPPTSRITIMVTGGSAVVFGVLSAFYGLWLVRRLRARHNRKVGKQLAGKYGEGKVDISTIDV